METATRKLIDLEPSVIKNISYKARRKNMTFKKYVEELIRQDAKTITEDDRYIGIHSQDLLSLVGIAKDVKTAEKDDKLEYILSKL